jgi:hypothetical protein
MTHNRDSIMALDYDLHARLRYCTEPNLRLNEHSTRADVRRVRHLIPQVSGIGPVRLAEIDRWLADGPRDTPLLPTFQRPRRKRYRFVLEMEVDTDALRRGHNARAWPAAIIRQHLTAALQALGGHVRFAWTAPPDG